MSHENLLQHYLAELEAGTSLQELIDRIPEDENGLRMELKAAGQLRTLRPPQPDPAARAAGKQRLLEALAADKQPEKSSWSLSQPGFGWLIPVTAVALVVVMGVLSLALAGGFLFARTLSGNVAVVDSVSGRLEVNREAGSDWQALSSGDRIRAGQTLRTAVNASAVIEFADGSRTVVGPSTTIQFEEIKRSPGNVVTIQLSQLLGASSHRVEPFQSAASAFIVHTPAGGATVHGTEFSVSVAEDGASSFSVDKGTIAVEGASRQVFVSAGQVTGLQSGEDPADPAYQFNLQGMITSIEGSIWTVSGVAITVSPETQVVGSPVVGDSVYIEGRILQNQTWIADQIVLEDSAPISSMTGLVEAIGEQSWTINGQTFSVTAETSVDESIAIGDAVKVIFSIMEDGQWLALSVRSLEEKEEPQPTATPEFTPDPAAQPSLAFVPDEIVLSQCSEAEPVTGTLVNTSSEADDVAAGVVLGYEIIQGAELVTGVDLAPDGFEQIASGEFVQFSVTTTFAAAWTTAPDGTEVKIQVFVADEINRPDHLPGRLTITYVRDCMATPTPEWTPTPEGTPTATPEVSPTSTPEVTPTDIPDEEETDCTGANPHPTGLTLANRYGVTYEEIMGWFCQGFGFGEIDLAYGLSLESGVPVTEIFAMRTAGMGWGQIKQELGTKGNPGKPPKENPGKKP